MFLAAVAFIWGLSGQRRAVVAGMPPTLTICFGISGLVSPYDDGLWPIGAFLVAVASCAGAAVVAAGGEQIRLLLRD